MIMPRHCASTAFMDHELQRCYDHILDQEFRALGRQSRGAIERFFEFKSHYGPYSRFEIVDGEVRGPETRIKKLLRKLASQRGLPDTLLVYLERDCVGGEGLKSYLVPPAWHGKVPCFVSARRRRNCGGILFCDWHYDVDSNHPQSWNAIATSFRADSALVDYDSKIAKAFWRGGMNDGRYRIHNWRKFPRGRLVWLSRNLLRNDLDAAFNSNDRDRLQAKEFRQVYCSDFIEPVEAARYKYQVDLDGFTATFTSLPWKLLSGSLVFKQQSHNLLWFHHLLKPWVHYVPINKKLSDFEAKLQWAKDNDSRCKEIASAGREFAKRLLMPESIADYCAAAINRYASTVTG